MTPKAKLVLCLLGNTTLLILVITISVVLNDGGKYFRFGPNEGLLVISTRVDTYGKYFAMLTMIVVLNVVSVVVEEFGMPVLGFNVYNPDKKHITEFTKNELNFFANAMYLASSMRSALMVIVTISQIDIALFSVIIKEITSIFTVRALLNEKTFGKLDNTLNYKPESSELDSLV